MKPTDRVRTLNKQFSRVHKNIFAKIYEFSRVCVVAREILDTNENSLKRWQQRTVIKQANRLYVTKRDSSWRWKTAKTATMKFTLKLSSREPYKEVDCNVVNCISGSKAQRFPALHFNAASRPILRFYLSLSLSFSFSGSSFRGCLHRKCYEIPCNFHEIPLVLTFTLRNQSTGTWNLLKFIY